MKSLEIDVEYKNEYELNSICFDYVKDDINIYVFIDEEDGTRKFLRVIDKNRAMGLDYEDNIFENWWSKPYHSIIEESIEITNKILKEV